MGNCISGGPRNVRSNPAQRDPASASASASAPVPDTRKSKERLGARGEIPGLVPRPTRPNTELGRAQWDKVARKLKPYIAKAPDSEKQNLNGAVSVHLTNEGHPASEREVVCRHFAIAFTQHSGKKMDLVRNFSLKKGIHDHFDGKLHDTECDLKEAVCNTPSTSKHLVVDTQLGQYLSALAQALPAPAANHVSEINSLLMTCNHAMALHVQRKSKDGVEYFSAKLYDPNVTSAYKRVEARTAKDFTCLSMDKLMVSPTSVRSYGLNRDSKLCMVAICLDNNSPVMIGRRTVDPTDVNMSLAIRYGSSDDIDAMSQALDAKKDLVSQDTLFKVLQACPFPGDVPAMRNAFLEGVSNSMQAFGNAVRKSGLPDEQRFELLEAKGVSSCPGMFIAMQNGLAHAVADFGHVVRHSELTNDKKFELLAAKDDRFYPGLFMAMQEGHADVVRAFGQAVRDSGLSDDHKFKLLAAKDAKSVTGLRIAKINSQGEVIDAFFQVVRESGLSADKQLELRKLGA